MLWSIRDDDGDCVSKAQCVKCWQIGPGLSIVAWLSSRSQRSASGFHYFFISTLLSFFIFVLLVSVDEGGGGCTETGHQVATPRFRNTTGK